MDRKGQSAIESPAATARQLRGQSAMEYLMTYGWAILVIITVIAVLFYIGVLNPKNLTPTSCTFPSGMSCASYKLTASNSQLNLTIGHATGRKIRIIGVNCTQQTLTIAPTLAAVDVNISTGESKNISNIQCYDTAGAALGAGRVGDVMKLYLWMNSTDQDSVPQHNRTTIGSIQARYE